MKLDRWVRKEALLGMFWLVGRKGFGPLEAAPDGASELNAFYSTDESPFFSSRVFSLKPLLELDAEYPRLVQQLVEHINTLHIACSKARTATPPPFYMYPFVRPGDFKIVLHPYAPHVIARQAQASVDDLLKSSVGKRFHWAVYTNTELLRSGWSGQPAQTSFTDEVLHLRPRDRSRLVSRHYVLACGDVWSSELELTSEQWLIAIKRIEEDKKQEVESVFRNLQNESSREQGSRPPIPEIVRNEVWRRDNGRCVGCGSNEKLEFDHIIPVIRGGSHTARNLQLLCEPCNRRKGSSI